MMHVKPKNTRDDIEGIIYGSVATDISVPKFKMPESGLRSDIAHALVRDELFLDGNARQNLATFCQTYPNDDIHQLMDLSIDKNMIDKDEYPATAEIENRCVHILPICGTRPNLLILRAADHWIERSLHAGGFALSTWRERIGRRVSRRQADIVTGPVQVCWHKFARYFDVELREIPLERGRLGMTPEEVLKRVDENTIGVMATFGVTLPANTSRSPRSPTP